MVITEKSVAGRYELQLQGRLDANWADHVSKAIEGAVRAGHHELDLDFAEVTYISSAGIRVLLKHYKQLKAARGCLRVLRPTAAVLAVLKLSGIAWMLVTEGEGGTRTSPASAGTSAQDPAVRRWERDGVEFEWHEMLSDTPLNACLHGRPEAFANGELSATQSQRLRCTSDLVAVGLGAFGAGPEDTQGRFGEALAVAGAAMALPTDGSSVPDYQLTEGQLVPELHLLYGLTARGNFSRLLRFEAGRSRRGVVGLSELVESALEHLQSSSAGFAILAESVSVVGAMLKNSPAVKSGTSALAFPGIRDWLNFTTERSNERNLVLIAGLAAREPPPSFSACLRAVGPGTTAHGHFHAAVFPYRPLPKGRLELQEAVAQVLSTDSAQAVMHLMADEREFEGVGQTDLMRGACWVAPLRWTVPELQTGT
jgi:anti-anti-sigma factor